MRTVNMHDAKTNLSRLVAEVEQGEEIVIARAGVPVAKLVPYVEAPPSRAPGAWRDQVWMSDDIDEPDEALIASFYERPRPTG